MEFDETLRFWCPCVALDVWINFVSCSDEILQSDFRRSKKEVKRRKTKNKNLSLHPLSLFTFSPFDFSMFISFLFYFFNYSYYYYYYYFGYIVHIALFGSVSIPK